LNHPQSFPDALGFFSRTLIKIKKRQKQMRNERKKERKKEREKERKEGKNFKL